MKTDLEYNNEKLLENSQLNGPLWQNSEKMMEINQMKKKGMGNREKEWQECHYYFMQWMGKMRELMLEYPY